MFFSEDDLFEIVDALFHMYASSYRTDAEKELKKIIERRKKYKEDDETC